MFESEIKYRVRNSDALIAALNDRTHPSKDTYRDTYFFGMGVDQEGEVELRLRVISSESRGDISILTWKGDVVDELTRSKAEIECVVQDAEFMCQILKKLGFEVDLEFSKHCINWRLPLAGAAEPIQLTHVRLDFDSDSYLEIETQVGDASAVPSALHALRKFAGELGLSEEDETTVAYTELYRNWRSIEERT